MKREEYYKLLKEKYEQTDLDNRESIKKYNEYARELRKIIDEEGDKGKWTILILCLMSY